MVLTIHTDQASLSQRLKSNDDTGMRALNSPTLKKSRDKSAKEIEPRNENENYANTATTENDIAEILEGNAEAEIERILGNQDSRSHRLSKKDYDIDNERIIDNTKGIKSTKSYEAPIADNGTSSIYVSPVPLIKRKPTGPISTSKRVAEFANKPNLKFAFENAMLTNKSKETEANEKSEKEIERERERERDMDREREKDRQREKDRERERDWERERERERSYAANSKKSIPRPSDRHYGPPSPIANRNDDLLSKKPDKQSKKPSAAVHKPPPRKNSQDLLIDRTDYGNRQASKQSMFDRRNSSCNSTVSMRHDDEKIEKYSEPIPSHFSTPQRRFSRDRDDQLLQTPKSNSKSKSISNFFSPSKMGFGQFSSANASPIKRMGFNPFYSPKPSNGQRCL